MFIRNKKISPFFLGLSETSDKHVCHGRQEFPELIFDHSSQPKRLEMNEFFSRCKVNVGFFSRVGQFCTIVLHVYVV